MKVAEGSPRGRRGNQGGEEQALIADVVSHARQSG